MMDYCVLHDANIQSYCEQFNRLVNYIYVDPITGTHLAICFCVRDFEELRTSRCRIVWKHKDRDTQEWKVRCWMCKRFKPLGCFVIATILMEGDNIGKFWQAHEEGERTPCRLCIWLDIHIRTDSNGIPVDCVKYIEYDK